MKVRVTLMTENDRHPNATKEEIENTTKKGWELLCMMFNNSYEQEEAVTVEKCELVEI